MKYKKLFYSLIFISITVSAQNYTTYSIFENKFQAVFPDKPEVITVNNFGVCMSIDRKNKMSFIAQSLPCSFVCEVGKYNKKDADVSIAQGMIMAGVKIVSFDSRIDKNQYIAIAHVEDKVDEVVFHRFKKILISKKGHFSWTVSYINAKDKKIFDTYQSSVQMVHK